MRAGRLDRMITIQRKVETESPSGEPIATWTNIALRRSASYRSLRGGERFTAEQYVANEQVEFQIRFSSDVAGLSPLDRIVYPALQADSPPNEPETRRIYDVIDASEIGRREGVRVVAVRRADVTS